MDYVSGISTAVEVIGGIAQAWTAQEQLKNLKAPEMPDYRTPEAIREKMYREKQAAEKMKAQNALNESIANDEITDATNKAVALAREYGRTSGDIISYSQAAGTNKFNMKQKVRSQKLSADIEADLLPTKTLSELAKYQSLAFDYDYKNFLAELDNYNKAQVAYGEQMQAGISNAANALSSMSVNADASELYQSQANWYKSLAQGNQETFNPNASADILGCL